MGNPLNDGFLMPVIIGLGLLSLFNIVLTIITPLLKKPEETKPKDAAETARQQRNVIELASNVMEAIQKIRAQNE